MCYINSRSLKNKTLYLNDYITTHKYDLVAFTETWFNSTDNNESYIITTLEQKICFAFQMNLKLSPLLVQKFGMHLV